MQRSSGADGNSGSVIYWLEANLTSIYYFNSVSNVKDLIVIAKHFGINRGFLLVRLKSRKRKFLILTNFVSLTTTNVKK